MPTKSVAFVRDTIYLDALQYRQASGRAGRRGFDVQGHVIFIDIPLPKVRHLLVSAIPNIHAQFPTLVTFLMRLLDLCSNAKDSTNAINQSNFPDNIHSRRKALFTILHILSTRGTVIHTAWTRSL